MTPDTARPSRGPRANRGQSSVIGVVLIVAVTVMGVTGITLFGASALRDAQTQSEIDAAEHAMTQLDSRFSLVALGSAEHQGSTVELGSGASLQVDGDRGWMNVSVDETGGGFEVFNTSLGALIYENGDTTVAYQGGGVWKRTGGGSVMVSPPEFHYRTEGGEEPTLTLPLVVLRGDDSLSGDPRVTHVRTLAKYPNKSVAGRSNPLSGGEINVTVKSDYYRAWGQFFEDRTNGSVAFDHARGTVTLTLVVPQSAPTVSGAIVSGASGTLTFGQQSEVDSYNSTDGPYSPGGDDTSIIAAGDVEMGQNSVIDGDVVTGGTLLFSGGAGGQVVTGNLTYGSTNTSEPGKVQGWIRSGADVASPDPVGWFITKHGDDFDAGSNDNGADSDISGTTLTCAGDCTLPGGDYYLDEIDLGGSQVLELDTSSDDVEIYVDGDVVIGNNEKIRVTGDGRAQIYVNRDLDLTSQGTAEVVDDRAPGLWFYLRPNRQAKLQKSRFVGVIYGPGSGGTDGVDITLKASNDVFGGLVGSLPEGGSDGIGQDDAIHFDEALSHEEPLAGATGGQPTVTYLHVTVNEVNVSAG